MTELSVVVLCYHSGKTILPFFDKLREVLEKLHVEYEIVLVANDFAESKDETVEIVRQLSLNQPKVKHVTLIKEGMMGWDMLQGMNSCSGRYICVIDGDGQFPIESVAHVYSVIKDSDYDIVKTYRVKRHDGFYRILLSSVYNLFFSIIYPGLHSKDVNSKPKILPREVYSRLNLQSTDWFIDAEIMIAARDLKLKIKEVPITFSANASRKSFVKVSAIIEFVLNMVRFKFRRRKK
jgi:glycosyltransferase involved in cell wall biosynthesis